jgi:hypothetical protein
VRAETNPSHGIKPGGKAIFNSLLELPLAIERVLIQQGIQLHPGRRDRKYLSRRA